MSKIAVSIDGRARFMGRARGDNDNDKEAAETSFDRSILVLLLGD